MKQTTTYMAVQVLSRYPNGTLKEWYEGAPYYALSEAKAEAKQSAKNFPGTPYTVIEVTVKEVSKEFKK